MTIKTRRRTTAATDTAARRCVQLWRCRNIRASGSERRVCAAGAEKNQTSISQDIEEKILSMYSKGMTTGDIETHNQDIYSISVSDSTVSRITDRILPIALQFFPEFGYSSP